jgi:hypothetical protein
VRVPHLIEFFLYSHAERQSKRWLRSRVRR